MDSVVLSRTLRDFQADDALQRDDERLTLSPDTVAAGTLDWDVSTGELNWSADSPRIFGGTVTCPASFKTLLDRVHPLDRHRVAATMSDSIHHGGPYEAEFRLIGYDGVERSVVARGVAFFNETILRVLGVFVDVTGRHRAQQQLRELGGRLLNAHEQERRRLSRELHDGVGQQLGVLSAELGILRDELTGWPLAPDRIQGLLARVEQVGSELRRVSHELHPAWLEQLGLPTSLRRLCAELSSAHRLAIHLELGEMPAALPPDIALCLYRIAQEALHNVVKHSAAANATVRLAADARELSLSVVDDGVGFDPASEEATDGLGLISMRERAHQVDGHVTLTSRSGQGTRVDVRLALQTLVAS